MPEVIPAASRPPSFAAALAMLWLGALLAWAGVHAAAADTLLWHSDAWSLAVYFGAVGLALILPAAALAGLTALDAACSRGSLADCTRLYTLVLAAAVLNCFLSLAAPMLGGAIGRWLAGSGAACRRHRAGGVPLAAGAAAAGRARRNDSRRRCCGSSSCACRR